MTFVFILAIIAVLIAIIALIYGISQTSGPGIIVGVVFALLGVGLFFWSSFWSNADYEAKVQVNSVDRSIAGPDIVGAGSGFKPAWVDFIDFDLLNQELVYAGGDQGAPSYSGGSVNGREITVSVGGVSGGSTQGQADMTFNYSLAPDKIQDIYKDFRTQQNFTEQVISRQVLSIARQIPSSYSAVEFRGSKRGEAELAIQEALNAKLAQWGVTFSAVTIQDVRYSAEVEAALTQIEQANQAAQTAEANQRTKQVENETKIAAAQAEAEANRILAESLTAPIIEQRKIDALIEVSKNGDLIIDGGQGGVLLNRNAPAAQ